MFPISRTLIALVLTSIALALTAFALGGDADAPAEATSPTIVDAGPRLGSVRVYSPDDGADSMAIVISGDAGWSSVADQIANLLRERGALIAGVDGLAYPPSLGEKGAVCADPAADFERLSRQLQQRDGATAYRAPILVGYGDGAALAFAAAANAPPGTFAAVLSLGFCARLRQARWCEGAGIEVSPRGDTKLQPRADLPVPWVLLHGELDTHCTLAEARVFAHDIPSAKVVGLPNVDDTFTDGRWVEKFQDAYAKLGTASTEASPLSGDVSDLPLTEVAATHGDSRRLAILLTGDGGFADLDRGVSDELAAAGIPVVALSTLRYFWSEQQPAHAARDLERIIDHYLPAWRKDRVLLIGYSFGADVLPFVVTQMSGAFRDRIESLNLLGLAPRTSFEIHVADWIPGSEPEGAPVAPEFDDLRGVRTLCIYGADETDSLCPLLPQSDVTALKVPGDHHFDDDAAALGRHILDFAGP